jgi:DNA-binding MarR family transcriptional regulator
MALGGSEVMNQAFFGNNNIPTKYTIWRVLDHTRYMIFRLREKELAKVGLTPEQAQVLDIIYEAGGSTSINTIVRATQRQHNSMSTLITRMTRLGLVRKTRTRRDKRVYRVTLTEKGATAYLAKPNEYINQVFSCLTEKENNELHSYLRRVFIHAYELAGIEFYPNLLSDERQSSSETSV